MDTTPDAPDTADAGPAIDPACPESAAALRAWPDEPTLAWTGFHSVHSRLVKSLEHELSSRHGIGLSGYKLLARLIESPGGDVRMSELADGALLSPSRVSRLVDQLERDGYIERSSCPTDSRGVCAELTASGRAFLGDVHRTYVATVEREFFARLGDRDVKALARVFARLA